MARAFVSTIIDQLGSLASEFKDRLGSLIASEVASIVNVEEEVEKLKLKFQVIQAKLDDAEERQVKDKAVKLWLERLKDVYYEMDDVLDKWNTAKIKADIEKEEEAETSTAKRRKVLSLTNLNSSVATVFQRHDIAHKIKEITEKLDEIDREGGKYKFAELNRGNEEVVRPPTNSHVDVSKILGRDKVKGHLVNILLGRGNEEERRPHVISLVGMGGVGKTTLAQLAYNDSELSSANFDKKGWVCVSDPFDQFMVAKAIIKICGGGDSNTADWPSLVDEMNETIKKKKLFLVLDDVWTEDFMLWEPFKLALRKAAQGSRILVTTRNNRVAEVMESVEMINLEKLSNDYCWLIFSTIAFSDRDSEQRKDLEVIGRKISDKCKGLPLAARTLGSLMRFKSQKEQWEMVFDSKLWKLHDIEKGLFAPLLLSYYDLPLPLRCCFSYCAIFPKDYVFFKEDLVSMWIAQGYIESNANNERIVARDYFENLVIRSLFQVVGDYEYNNKIIEFKMHDIVHDLAQFMAKTECITINGYKESGQNLQNARHLYLEIPKNAQIPESIYGAKNLRTLILIGLGNHNLSKLFQQFTRLRTLTLSYQQDETKTIELPDAIGNLLHLRYLKIHSYRGDRLLLPQGMSKLINLKHLILEISFWIRFPREIGRLSSLTTLSHFFVGGKDDSQRCELRELKYLNHLQGTLQIHRMGNVVDACEAKNAELEKKIGLRDLYLDFFEENVENHGARMENDVSVLNALEPPPGLEKLEIHWYRGTTMFPNWMMSLAKLKSLTLKHGKNLERLPPLGKLQFLEYLSIRGNAFPFKKVGVEFLGIESENKKDGIIKIFPNLKTLQFKHLHEWEEWIGIGGQEEEDRIIIMPCLQKFEIYDCRKLKSLPDFLFRTSLPEFEVNRSPILCKRYQRGTGEDWAEISHIPNISINDIEVQRDGQVVIRQEFERKFHEIQAKLNDAEERQVTKKAVKLWLEKLNDVFYEMDDLLDEWNTAKIKTDIEKEEKAETSTAKRRKVLSLTNSNSSVYTVSQRHDIALKIKEITGKLDEIDKEGDMYQFLLTRHNKEVVRPPTDSHVDVSNILGRDKVKVDLVNILLGRGNEEERRPHVISIVGMGGVGKTTLAQLAYNDSELSSAHFEKKGWVCVSDSFDKFMVAKAIIQAFGGDDSNITQWSSLMDKMCETIRGRKLFLVFDDVWTEDSMLWEPFRLALLNAAQGSRILVTTRKSEVADVMRSAKRINLKELSDDDCWSIFSTIAFFDRDSEQRKDLEEIGRKISDKCKGLPLAARTLGSLMRFKSQKEQWEMVCCSGLWELQDVERGLFAPLLLSYYDLPSPLRRCFSYCAVFPKDYVFFEEDLVSMWMAQGCIMSNANMEKIVAREYLKFLLIRSLFQDFRGYGYDENIMRLKMHDMVHDLAQLMAKNECITISGYKESGPYLQNAQHLYLEIPQNAQIPESIYGAKNLRTLIFINLSDHNLSKLFQHFTRLRTLTLSYQLFGTKAMELPDAVGNLLHLRYLKIHYYHGDRLPETICNLCNLQILNIAIGSQNKLKKLPQGMSKLINLKHLILEGIQKHPIEVPRGIGRLSSLTELSHFYVGGKDDSQRCELGELKYLNRLEGTLKIYGLGNVVDVWEAENAELKKKIGLRDLYLHFSEENVENHGGRMETDVSVLNALEPPPDLEKLEIGPYRGTTIFPNWMMSLANLKRLTLIACENLDRLPPLGKLQFLEYLLICGASFPFKEVGVEFLGIESENKKDGVVKIFPNLKTLRFMCLHKWEEWVGIGGQEEEDCIIIMPCLQMLEIHDCRELKSLPDFLFKTSLQDFEVYVNPILCKRYQSGTGEDWAKISHIPNIKINYIEVQRDGQEVIRRDDEEEFDQEEQSEDEEEGQ